MEDIVSSIVGFPSSREFLELQEYYQRKSCWEILGIARVEVYHSAFIAWLLDPSESHAMGVFCLRRLLAAAVLVESKIGTSCCSDWLDETFRQAIIVDNYTISDVRVETEKVVSSDKPRDSRLDIFVECKISIESRGPFDLKMIIENKVGSSEHGNQTSRYRDWAAKEFPGAKLACFFLSPEFGRKEEALSEACFLRFSYQHLLEYVITPLLVSMRDSQERARVEDYVRALSIPAGVYKREDKKDKGNFRMAITDEEKGLLKALWARYENILLAAVGVIAEDKVFAEELGLSEKDQESCRKVVERVSARDRTKYNLKYQGCRLNESPLPKNRVLLEIIKKMKEIGLESFSSLIQRFIGGIGKTKGLRLEENVKDKKRCHSEFSVTFEGKTYLVSNQWGIGGINDLKALLIKEKSDFDIEEV
ncbi:MAG: PD-(D/E)XK nuclease family protein [Opitutales bacterium]|nr:PD-(D/E)XK nuclease family protein [Opitutales bacterium]